MSSLKVPPTTDDYRRAFDRASRRVPEPARSNLRMQISEHLEEIDARYSEDPRATRQALVGLGEPGAVIDAELEGAGLPSRRPTTAVWLTPLGLAIGGVVFPAFGWVIAVFVLWKSTFWSTAEKIRATFVLPGGLTFVLIVALVGSGENKSAGSVVTVLIVALALVQLASMLDLWRRAWIAR